MNTAHVKSAPAATPASYPSADALLALGIEIASAPEPDLVSAHKWFNLAALRGSREAGLHRHELAREMSPTEVAAAQRAAREWLRTH